MAQDQTVVDHLLMGRQALSDEVGQNEAEIERLQGEVLRLSTAVEQLDSVISMINSGALPSMPARTAPAVAAPAAASAAPVRAEAPVKRAPARVRKPAGQAPKSIRVHVLEMLAGEDRDWSLAEIIDRIHDAGIQAHDDAVRSITIKLMKDGRVERVGRGQYRLARRGSARSNGTPATPPAAVVDEPAATASEPVDEVGVVTAAENAAVDDTAGATDSATVTDVEDTIEVEAPAEAAEPETDTEPEPEPARSYTPPLNLGQPWN